MKKILSRGSPGFTLIELLIVIVIIVIVVTIGAVSYTTVSRNARDAQRKADLAKIADALERSFADFGVYPASNSPANGTANTLLSCVKAGHNPSIGDDTDYLYIPIFYGEGFRYDNHKFSCQDLNSDSFKIYMDETPFDPLNNTPICDSATCEAGIVHYYNYFSYLKDGTICYDSALPICPQHVLADFSDFKPYAHKYKLVAIMENESNASNAPGDQDAAICRRPGSCYVISSPNF